MKTNNKILSLGGIIVIFIVIVFCFAYLPKNSIAFGVKLGGENIGGLSTAEAEKKIENKVNQFLEKNVTFNFNISTKAYSQEIKLKELGVTFNIKESLKKPFLVGKKENFFQNFKEKIWALQGRYHFPLDVEINEETFDKIIAEKFSKFETLPQNAEVLFNEQTLIFEIKPEKEGLLFPKNKIKEALKKDSAFLKTNDFYIALEKSKPEINSEEAAKAKEKAEEILNSGQYILLADNKKINLSKKILGNLISFDIKKEGSQNILSPNLDKELIKNYLTDLSKSVNVKPQDPILSFENNTLKILVLPREGKILNIEKSAEEIQKQILENSTTNTQILPQKQISLIFDTVEPKITNNKIQELQIEKLIGKGSSNFAGSPKNRVHNIQVATAKLNGTLIAPGEEFSFNKTLGETGPAEGYLPELVIKNNKTVPEYGGGVCQVSTTIFRAAVYSGMNITERHPHAYPVKYYNPQGFDATVYLPKPDLKFINNTNGWILIQAKIEGNNLTFEFYGKDDGRKVIVQGPYQYDFKEDGSMKARLEEQVWKDGKLFLQKTFLSSYASPKLYPTTSSE